MSSSIAPGTYQHEPLKDARSIRVLMLEPALSYDSPIRCSLVEVSLDTIDESDYGYTALSYVWGYKKGDREIICDGKTLLVTRNCENALRTLRDKDATERFWVDAICIDQTMEPKGLQERSHQIKLMGEIYRSAVGVVVWLGDSDPARALGMEHIERVAKYDAMEYNGYYLQRLYAKLMLKRCIKRMWEFSDKNFDSEGNSPLLPILRSPWILRIWTVQEVAFAQSCAVVFGYRSGYYLLSWREFSRAMSRLVPVIDVETAIWAAGLAFKELLRREISFLTAGKGRVPTDTRRILDILELLHHMQATESRDMVYAIYPILESFGVTLPDPDYSKPVETIYEEMARSIMIATQGLEQFRFVSTCARKPNLQSWVPDWQDENHLNFGALSFETAYGDSSPVTSPETGKIAIYGKEIGKVRMRATRDCRMEGRVLKAEKDMKVLSSGNYGWYRANIPLIQTLKEWLQLSKNQALDRNDYPRISLFLQTLLLGSAVTSEVRKAFEVWLSIIQYPRNCKYDLSGAIQYAQVEEAKDQQNVAHWTQEIRETLIVARAVAAPDTSGHKGRSLPHAAAVEKFHDRLYDCCRDRAFFITEDGRMGTCFYTVEAGDVLVLFKGTREPIVLRQAEENYVVISPAYVVGLNNPNDPLDGDISRMRKYTLI